jgi:putative phosphoesterase
VTRLAVLSDIHGNLPALLAVLEDASRQAVDGYIQAGDYTGGPQATECLQIQRSLPGWMIRGNGEVNLHCYEEEDCPPAWKTDMQFTLLRWDHAHLCRAELDFLYALPEQAVVQIEGTAPIRVVHGSPRSPYEKIFIEDTPVLERALTDTNEDVLICGHTHCPWFTRRDGRLALNPGAVCGPLDGFRGAQYAILSWQTQGWQVKHRAIRYDLAAVRRAFENSGLLAACGALGRAFLLSIESGNNVAADFLNYAHCLAEKAGLTDPSVVPDEIWERAETTFEWKGVFH